MTARLVSVSTYNASRSDVLSFMLADGKKRINLSEYFRCETSVSEVALQLHRLADALELAAKEMANAPTPA